MTEYFFVLLLCATLAGCREAKDTSNRLGLSHEKILVKKLLRDYKEVGRVGRPVRNISQPVTVEFGLGLIKMDVVEKDNMLTMSVWTQMKWRDEYLTWNPRRYGGLVDVKLPTNLIWMPDIMLFNTASTETLERDVPAVVTHDGNITWFPHQIFHSTCAIDVQRYPFDNQTCHVWFGSWTLKSHELELNLAFPHGIDLGTFKADFKETSKWDIEQVDASRLGEAEGGGDISVLTFTLHLRRRIIFSSYILTIPVIFMSFLTLLVFYLPVDSADKSSLGLTIFGSLLLLLLILVEAAPPTASAVPMLGLYYCFNIVIVILSILLSSIVCKLGDAKSCRRRNQVPRCIKIVFFRGLAKLLCLRQPSFDAWEKDNGNGNVRMLDQEHEISRMLVKLDTLSSTGASVNAENHSEPKASFVDQVKRVSSNLNEYMEARQEDTDKESQNAVLVAEWQFLASILDRIFLVIYLVVILVSLALLFPR